MCERMGRVRVVCVWDGVGRGGERVRGERGLGSGTPGQDLLSRTSQPICLNALRRSSCGEFGFGFRFGSRLWSRIVRVRVRVKGEGLGIG